MDNLFLDCSSLSYLPDISKWNTNRVESIDNMFYNCISLTFLPDLSKWNFSTFKIPDKMFLGCLSLSFFPDNCHFKDPFIKKDLINDCINSLNSLNYEKEDYFK